MILFPFLIDELYSNSNCKIIISTSNKYLKHKCKFIEYEIAEEGNVINYNSFIFKQSKNSFRGSFTKMRIEFIFHFSYGCPISTSSRGYRSLLGISVRYNGVIRNKTEKTKETAGTRVGFWLGLATCWCYRKAYANIRDHGPYTRTSVPRRYNGQLEILFLFLSLAK